MWHECETFGEKDPEATLKGSILARAKNEPTLFLTLFRPGFVYRFKVQGGPLMISETIEASPMKLCTVIVLLSAYQNAKINFPTYDL